MNKELNEKIFKVGNDLYIKSVDNKITKKDCMDVETKLGKLADEVKQVLTPPTPDEVCKALSEYVNQYAKDYTPTVRYEGNLFVLYKNGEISKILVKTINGEVISTNVFLPPHLITMIGMFYEGVNNNE